MHVAPRQQAAPVTILRDNQLEPDRLPEGILQLPRNVSTGRSLDSTSATLRRRASML